MIHAVKCEDGVVFAEWVGMLRFLKKLKCTWMYFAYVSLYFPMWITGMLFLLCMSIFYFVMTLRWRFKGLMDDCDWLSVNPFSEFIETEREMRKVVVGVWVNGKQS